MLLATPALEAPVFLSAASPESTMPKQLVLTEGVIQPPTHLGVSQRNRTSHRFLREVRCGFF